MPQRRHRVPTLALALLATAAVAMAQEAPSSQKTPPKTPGQNAADLYLTAIAEAWRGLRIEPREGTLPLPVDDAYLSDEWRAAVAETSDARALFAQAARFADCRFDPTLEDGLTLYGKNAIAMNQLAALVAAHGHQHAASDPDLAMLDFECLLGHARHTSHQPCSIGMAISHICAESACDLLLQILASIEPGQQRTLLERCVKQLDEYTAGRATVAQMADGLLAEVQALLTMLPAETSPPAPLDKVRTRILADAVAFVAPLRGDEPPSAEQVAKVADRKVAELRQAMKTRLLMSDEQKIEAAAAGLTLMLLPNTKMVVEGRDKSAAREAACRSRLRELLAAGPGDGK